MSIFGSKDEKKTPKTPPMMTIQALQSIKEQVRLNPLAGKGIYTLDELENDAIVAQWNIYVIAAREAAESPNEVLELKKTA